MQEDLPIIFFREVDCERRRGDDKYDKGEKNKCPLKSYIVHRSQAPLVRQPQVFFACTKYSDQNFEKN